MSVHDTGSGRPPRGARGRKNLARPLVPGQGPLARIRPVVVFAVVVVVFAVGIIVGGIVGAVLLGILALGVIGLLAGTWPHLTPGERAGRVLILALLIAVGIAVLVRGGLA